MLNSDLWMQVAYQELGTKTLPKGQSNARITQYHEVTNIEGYDDKAAWCSSFINWVFKQVGVHGTCSALARSWLDWGAAIDSPIPGCVVVLEREDPNGWKGHVGFFLRKQGQRVYLLGGNQLGEVREHYYDLSTVLAYRWPNSACKKRDEVIL